MGLILNEAKTSQTVCASKKEREPLPKFDLFKIKNKLHWAFNKIASNINKSMIPRSSLIYFSNIEGWVKDLVKKTVPVTSKTPSPRFCMSIYCWVGLYPG